MNKFKKAVIAIATVSTLAMATPASASPYQWVGPNGNHFGNGIATGVGLGIGLGITNNLLAPRPNTVVVQQPAYQPACRNSPMYDGFGRYMGSSC